MDALHTLRNEHGDSVTTAEAKGEKIRKGEIQHNK